jgi:hypothetical protein
MTEKETNPRRRLYHPLAPRQGDAGTSFAFNPAITYNRKINRDTPRYSFRAGSKWRIL